MAGRADTKSVQGDVRWAGQRPNIQFIRRYAAYVEQFDTLLDILTVEEMLLYTAELKRPLSEGYASKREAVHTLINDVRPAGPTPLPLLLH